MDIVAVHDSPQFLFLPDTAEDKPLFVRAVLSLAPVPDCKGHIGKGVTHLTFRRPASGSVLAVTHGLGFDITETVALVGQCHCSDQERKHKAHADQKPGINARNGEIFTDITKGW